MTAPNLLTMVERLGIVISTAARFKMNKPRHIQKQDEDCLLEAFERNLKPLKVG